MVVDYQNSKIYKIINDSLPELVYYGSTANTLTKRFGQHKSKSNKCSSKQLFDCDVKPQIFLVESYPCNSKDELNARERWHIENNVCVNKNIPNRTRKEYLQDNKEEISENNKQYRQDNKDKIKEYRQDNKEKIKESQKKWYQDNKEELLKKSNQYRQDNKEIITEKMRENRLNNKDKCNLQKKNYRDKNKDKINLERREKRLKLKLEKEKSNLIL